MKNLILIAGLIFLGIGIVAFPVFSEEGFSQKDRELLIELKVRVQEIDKRFEQIDKRFEQIDKRFEQIDKRFEQIDKRFEQVDKRFDQLMDFLYILSGIFTSLVAVVIGFAYWDRRTIIKEAKREAIEFIEKESLLRKILEVLKDLSREDKRIAEALKRANLL